SLSHARKQSIDPHAGPSILACSGCRQSDDSMLAGRIRRAFRQAVDARSAGNVDDRAAGLREMRKLSTHAVHDPAEVDPDHAIPVPLLLELVSILT
ncbi:hypothetical protein T310_9205, partial [Rasamsonia emersonii CBS 393.64]